jgi:hypothetical protein
MLGVREWTSSLASGEMLNAFLATVGCCQWPSTSAPGLMTMIDVADTPLLDARLAVLSAAGLLRGDRYHGSICHSLARRYLAVRKEGMPEHKSSSA